MKTDLLLLAGMTLALLAVPMVSPAEEDDDWTTRSPLAAGEPMEDCDIHHIEAAVALQPALPAEKADAVRATPDLVPAVAPVAIPAAATPAVAAPRDSTTQAAPRRLSPATLLTFALIASPGTALPQTVGAGRD